MLYKSLGHLCGCDGTFLFPQANGHVSQDQEEPAALKSTVSVLAEDETQSEDSFVLGTKGLYI